jgi:hypothetical protein
MLNRNKIIIFAIIALGLVVWAVGYIPRYPIWVDDFSCLGDDVFSRIIINGRYKRNNVNRDNTGFSMLDSIKIRRMSDSIFMGLRKDLVVNTFNTYGCGCQIVKEKDDKAYLVCKFRRQWRLKNIGMRRSTDITDLLIIPIVVLKYNFMLDDNGVIRNIDMQMIDMTHYKSSLMESIIIK